MAIATSMFRVALDAGVRAVRERLGLVTATLAEDIAGHARGPVVRGRGETLDEFRDVERRYRDGELPDRRPERALLPVRRLPLVGRDSDRARVRRLLVFDGSLTVGTLFAFIGYLANFFDPVQQLSQLYNTFLAAVAALDKIMDVLDEEPEVVDRRDARDLPELEGRRPVRGRPLRLRRGRRGAARDRPRRARRDDGRARRPHRRRQVDDREAPRPLLRPTRGPDQRSTASTCATSPRPRSARQLGVVPQEGFLFAGTVRDNIAFGRPARRRRRSPRPPGGRRPRLHHAARGRLRHRGGERGIRLSLGQRQLVAFARALLVQPRILVLDEATSSVDIGTERRIEAALRLLLADRTAFIIAHRLSTIREADLIVVLEHGRSSSRGRTPSCWPSAAATRSSTGTGRSTSPEPGRAGRGRCRGSAR